MLFNNTGNAAPNTINTIPHLIFKEDKLIPTSTKLSSLLNQESISITLEKQTTPVNEKDSDYASLSITPKLSLSSITATNNKCTSDNSNSCTYSNLNLLSNSLPANHITNTVYMQSNTPHTTQNTQQHLAKGISQVSMATNLPIAVNPSPQSSSTLLHEKSTPLDLQSLPPNTHSTIVTISSPSKSHEQHSNQSQHQHEPLNLPPKENDGSLSTIPTTIFVPLPNFCTPTSFSQRKLSDLDRIGVQEHVAFFIMTINS